MKISLATLFLIPIGTSAFTVVAPNGRPSTKVFLDDRIANMIDDETYRLGHKDEFDKKAAEAFQKVVQEHAPQTILAGLELEDYMAVPNDFISLRQKKRDSRMAKEDPQAYCADRCMATGNCEVFEESFEMSAKEVIAFYDECVLSDDEEPCDFPDVFLNPKDALDEVPLR